MHLTELLQRSSTSHRRAAAPGDPDLIDITFDSRAASAGTLFVALAGAAQDGHDYVRGAAARGASAVLVAASRASEFDDLNIPVVVVDDPRRRLGDLAATFFGDPSASVKIVGITGTNGKTTVSYLVEAVLDRAGLHPGVLGTVNYRWPGHVEPAANTTPESLVVQRLLSRMRDDGVRAVAMEVSSHGLATHRLEGTRFEVAVFTNLSQDHLDFHGTMREYRDAKRRLFTEYLPRSAGRAVINVDDAEGRALAALLGGDVVTTSAEDREATWRCTSWQQALDGTAMQIASPHGALTLQTRLLGRFNASNVLQTLAATDALGVDLQTAADALRDLRGVPGRLQHLGGDGQPHVFVDYAHTPDALARALDALRPLAPARVVVVFGCGGDRDRDKRPKMGAAAATRADEVVLTSDNPRSEEPAAIIADIEAGMGATPWHAIVDRADAIRGVIESANEDDVILIAGKGHETYQEVEGVRRPFDDVEQARAALRSRK